MAVADIACINMEYKCITSEKEKTADVYFCIRALILVVCVCIYFFCITMRENCPRGLIGACVRTAELTTLLWIFMLTLVVI